MFRLPHVISWATFLAAVMVGRVAQRLYKRSKISGTAIGLVGITLPLLVGVAHLTAAFYVVGRTTENGFSFTRLWTILCDMNHPLHTGTLVGVAVGGFFIFVSFILILALLLVFLFPGLWSRYVHT